MKRKDQNPVKNLNSVIMLSAWGFIIVLSSFLFFFVGRWIDVRFNTEPAFMIGLFILAVSLCIGRIFTEITKSGAQLKNIKHHV